MLNGLPQLAGAGLLHFQQLEPVSKTCKRRPEIVCNVVRYPAHVFHEGFYSIEHTIQVLGELVKIIARAFRRYPAR